MRADDAVTLRAPPPGEVWWQLIRFVIVGLLNTCFGYAIFAAMILLDLGAFVSLVLATVAGIAFNFQTSRRLVFRSGARGRAVRFLSLYLAVLGINWAALSALKSLGLQDLPAQALLVLPIAAMSFIGQKTFVFGSRAGVP